MRPALFSLIVCLLWCSSIRCQDIDNMDALIVALNNSKDARIGVLSESNFNSVKKKLPVHARPEVFEHEEDLVKHVLSGDVVAGLTSGLPESKYHQSFRIFPSGVIALHTILMAPDYSTDYLNGVKEPALSSKQLSLAINAAISQIQYENVDQKLAESNGPKEISQTFTCKSDNRSHFNLPNRDQAVGLLATVIKTGVIKVLCQGKPNWGDNDGNYQVVPPKGFFPAYLDKIVENFQKLSGPDNNPPPPPPPPTAR